MRKPNTKSSDKSGKDKGSRNPYKRGGHGKPQNKKEEDLKEPTDGRVNDSSFYYLDNTLRDQICNFSFNSFNGVIEKLDPNVTNSPGNATKEFYNGNIMAIELMPSVTPPRNPSAPTDGINLVALRNYSMLSMNSGRTSNYAPQDVTILMLALKALAETCSHFTRAFGLLYQYNMRNRDWPTRMLELMHIDVDDFRKNAATYRIRFNTIITAANKIPFFDNFGAFMKAKEIYSNVYMDDPSTMAQTYFFTPRSTWLFDEQYDSNGSGLKTWMDYSSYSTLPFGQMLSDFETMVTALLTSTTLNYIYADVLRVAEKGAGKLMHFDLVPDFYTIQFKISDEIESYINNMLFAGIPKDQVVGRTSYNDISSNANSNMINYNVEWENSNADIPKVWGLLSKNIVNFRSDNPDPETKIAATRLACRWKFEYSNNLTKSTVVAVGDYTPIRIRITDVYGYSDNIREITGSVRLSTTLATAQDTITEMGMIDKFKYAPRLFAATGASSGTDHLPPSGDLTYYTMLDCDFMYDMFDAEMLGEFALRL